MGLYARERYGVGQYLETSMMCSTGYVHSNEAIDYVDRPARAVVDSEQRGFHALYRLYQCAEDWLFLGLVEERQWLLLCDALGHQQWKIDRRFATPAARVEHDDALAAAIEETLAERSGSSWDKDLTARGLPVAATSEQRFEEFLAQQGILEPASNDVFGEYFRLRPRIRFSNAENRRGPAVSVGENTAEILDELGYSIEDRNHLLTSGVAFQRDLG
jgi:crotonobetainyl-CoA:carnitine CoA-transferase CaiB-like acyl-CoA transferase